MLEAGRRLFRFRHLLVTLTVRELKARYRDSVLGYLWSLVNPLLLLLVYTFVFSVIFNPRDARADPYSLFLITGLFPWIWFQASVLEGTTSLMANAGLIRKATFPAELLPVVPVLANLVHYLLALPVVGAAFAFYRFRGLEVGGWTALLLPLIIVLQLPLIAGLAVALGALNAHFKDVKDLVANLLTMLFFMTPILYTLDMVAGHPAIHKAVQLGPVAPFALAYQQVLFLGEAPGVGLWLQMAAVSAASWAFGSWLFDRLRDTLVEAV